MARALDLQSLPELAGLPFDLGDAAELALLFSENAGLQIDHLLIAVTCRLKRSIRHIIPIATSATINHGTHLITHPPALRAPIQGEPHGRLRRCSRR